jgi:hypothetical protein
MKKILLATLIAGSMLSLSSCDNGNYDAEPNVNTGEKNPLKKDNGVNVFLGNIKAYINGTEWNFTNANYQYLNNTLFVDSEVSKDSIFKRKLSMAISDVGGLTSVSYSFRDTLVFDTTVIYQAATDKDLVFDLKGKEDNNLRGTFSGKFTRTFPTSDAGESIMITNGEFYVPKKK